MTAISDRLDKIRRFIPAEFARKTRSLDDLSRYKATELRLLLLYVLPVVLIPLPQELYRHFLLLHCAMRILACPVTVQHKTNVKHAKTLLIRFVEGCSEFYGDAFLCYNLHNLLHLPDEVFRFGALDFFSCFFFENCLLKLTNLIKPGRDPLPQLVNRIMEKRCNPPRLSKAPTPKVRVMKQNTRLFIPSFPHLRVSQQIESLFYGKLRLTINEPNNCVVLHNGDCFLVDNLVRAEDNRLMIVGRKFMVNESLYDFPMDSKLLGMSVASTLSNQQDLWPIEEIRCKAISIEMEESRIGSMQQQKYCVIDILHCESQLCELF